MNALMPQISGLVLLFLAAGEVSNSPCRTLDFWVGTWNVSDEGGAEVGRSEIARDPGSCMVTEHFQGTDGSFGRSLTSFNPATRKWHKFFANDKGLAITMTGQPTAGGILFEGEAIRPDGAVKETRVLFHHENDTVEQRLEILEANGWRLAGTARYSRARVGASCD